MNEKKSFFHTHYSTAFRSSTNPKRLKHSRVQTLQINEDLFTKTNRFRDSSITFYNDAYKTHFDSKGLRKFNVLNEKDYANLSNIYNTSNIDSIPYKYNIPTHLSVTEKEEIKKVFGIKKDKTILSSVEEPLKIYRDPFKTKELLKAKHEIHRQLINSRLQHQMEKFYNTISKIEKNKNGLSKMPYVRISKIVDLGQRDGIESLTDRIQQKESENKVKDENKPNLFNLSTREQLLNEIKICFNKISTQLHPSARMHFTYAITENSDLFIFGGLLSRKKNDLWKFNLRSKAFTLKWEKIPIKEQDIPIARYGHSMTYFDNQFFIYGGALEEDDWKNKEDNVIVYDIKNRQFFYPQCQNSKNVPNRRNHIGIGIGTTMLIHGGIEKETGAFLNDIWLFDCNKYKWVPLLFKSKFKIPNIAFHCACLVIKQTNYLYNQLFNVYRFPEMSLLFKSKSNHNILEGVFVFGGIDKNGNFSNKLWCIKVGAKPCEVISPKIAGASPSPRINCGMCFINELDFLVIHGGKNNESNGKILNDVYILDLQKFNWIRPVYPNEDFLPFEGHVIFIYANTIYILGGINDEGFINFEFFTIELEYFKQRKNALRNY